MWRPVAGQRAGGTTLDPSAFALLPVRPPALVDIDPRLLKKCLVAVLYGPNR